MEGVYNLATGDELVVVASTNGNSVGNMFTGITADSAIPKTSWIITRLTY